jgi:hypothetical protein
MSTLTDFLPSPCLTAPQVEALPATVEAVTALWSSTILHANIIDAKILSVRHGSSTTLLVEVTFGPASKSEGLTGRIFIKGGFNPQLIALMPSLLDTYRREAEFYGYLYPKLSSAGMILPQPYYTAVDPVSGQGIVALEDLTSKKCKFGTPLETWPIDRVLQGVDQLAILHAKTWGCQDQPAYSWLEANSNSGLRGIIIELTKEGPFSAVVPKNLEVLGADVAAQYPVLLDRQRIIMAFKKLWAADDQGHGQKFRCFIHGDPHVDNTFMTAAGAPGFLDWQAGSVGNCFHDVAYFVASVLSVEDRRAHEVRILRHYLASLVQHGGPVLDWEDAWAEYRKHLFHGYVLCLTQPGMQSQENIWALVGRFIPAILDHSVVESLEIE